MNWLILIIFGILAIALIIFLIVRNQKDEKDFEKDLDNDFPKRKSDDEDIDIDDLTDRVH